ncbi:aKG-HExxH-type peptide beta-hydroxylase [Actinacidiphila acididurans]|uniref:HEXXH motif domain-containing protein n=1 Tax=Actinacidiphila acididurans TaxID=2784346 RepID=A0ABS2TNR3_9ACTN|nr:HEXXH motif-containing putative peptide modification protein [Actinacidiphila acididurans]MBM9503618.1 HEXXH motif domain-containing protein [Actinacidiphila acididurans]
MAVAETEVLGALGGTGSDTEALQALVAEQHRRRLLTLRALLDAVREAGGALPQGTAEKAMGDWRLLVAADRADRAAARSVVQYPLTGSWAERCLRDLSRPGKAHAAATALPHLSALAAAAAASAGIRFSTDVPVRDGTVALPTLGGYRLPPGTDRTTARVDGDGTAVQPGLGGYRLPPGTAPESTARVDGDGGRLWLRAGGATAEVRRGPDGVWRSAAAGWHPVRALWTDDHRPVLIDDTDPYRDEEHRVDPYGLAVSGVLDGAAHARWRTAWQDAQPWLRLGDGGRAREVAALLRCFVPLADSPSGAACSATLGEAFGALLTSTPQDGLKLAAALVHELQHTKLLALSRLTPLHTADGAARHWAPWRPDPRPFDGLFQGTYAHLALAGFHLDVARSPSADSARREAAWAAHCRYRQQVEAVLPQLTGSSRLTPAGRTLALAMTAQHTRLKQHTPPRGHLARATAYVETARTIWRRRWT